MIDLSFLTEEEQETILAVLKRDAELKKAEEQRVQNLQKNVVDKSKLRNLTGEWFYETKQLRHQDRIHGSDIIRASMRHTHKPLTILELSQILPDKSSFIDSKSTEVFVPPVMRGLLHEPHIQPSKERYQNQNPYETLNDTSKPVLQSPIKERKNPFNTELSANHTFKENDSQFLARTVDQTQTPDKEPLPSSDSCISYASNLGQGHMGIMVIKNTPVPISVSGNKAVNTSSRDCLVEVDCSGCKQINSASPRGILKHLSAFGTTDSQFSCLVLQSPLNLVSATETWIDKKQVRFSSALSQSDAEWQAGKELGEHSLLDMDTVTLSKRGNNHLNNNDLEHTCSSLDDTHRPLLSHSQADSEKCEFTCSNEAGLYGHHAGQHQEFGGVSEYCHSELLNTAASGRISAKQGSGKPVHLETEPEEECHSQAKDPDKPSKHSILQEKLPDIYVTSDNKLSTRSTCAVSVQLKQNVLGICKRERDQSTEEQSPKKTEVNLSKQAENGSTQNFYQGASDMTEDMAASVSHEAKISVITDVKTLQLTALQNTAFKETVTTTSIDTQQKATEGKAVPFPERVSNLKAFWEKENTGPKIIFTREEARHEDNNKAGKEASDVESINNMSAEMEMQTEDASDKSHETLSLETKCSLSVDLSTDDGTYRADPVLIYEETDDVLTISLTDAQISHENIITPLPSSTEFSAHKQEAGFPVSLLRQFSSSLQEDRPAKISQLKHFWEKEYAGPRVIVARVKDVLNSSVLGNRESQSGLRTSLDNRENFEGDEQASPYKTRSSVVLKSLNVTDKGFVSLSPERLQLRRHGSTGDVQSTCSNVKAETKSEKRPHSPQLHTPRSKDNEDEVRKSPSKTCHPRALSKESTPKKSRVQGSPLKTFPIDIDPQTKVVKEQQQKPVPKHKKSPIHDAKQMLTDGKPAIPSFRLPLHPENTETSLDNVNTQQSIPRSSNLPQSKQAFTKKSGISTHLARSFIPQDYQHYFGPQEKEHCPLFHQEKDTAADNHVVHRPQSAPGDSVGSQSETVTEWNLHTCAVAGYSGQDTATRAWSLSLGSSDTGYNDSSSSSTSALKHVFTRSMPASKSLEDLTSQTSQEKTKNNSSEQINLSVDDVSSHPPSDSSLSMSKQRIASLSVPVLQQDETETDRTFETNLSWRRNTGSSMSNISLSSGMASMSSVSGSVSSIHPAEYSDVNVQGSIQFAANYIQKLGEFHIFVVHCRDLAVADTKKNRSDPYVKCYLLPDKTKVGKRKTTVKKKTLNPTYNEILRFNTKMEVLKTQNMNISVWHNDTFGRNSFLGEVDLDLSEWDFNNTQINEYTLKARASAQASTPSPSHMVDSRGHMRVALRFLPQMSHSKITSRMETGEVQIWVKDCKNLPSVRGVTIDPFVKCTVLPDTSRKSRQKTRVVKRTTNPMFNHTMVYDGFRSEDLREACAELTVWNHDRLNNHYIGGLRLGLGTGKSYGVEVDWMDSTTDEAHLWQRMLQSDGEWVEDVLPLRMFVMAKSMSS